MSSYNNNYEYSSSSEDDVYFQSVYFFFDMNGLFFFAIGVIHLTHWVLNLYCEYKNTRSCGTSERKEGALGYVLLIVSFMVPMIVLLWFMFGIPVSEN